jgi:membrane fusion protein (multidrug efflux system)
MQKPNRKLLIWNNIIGHLLRAYFTVLLLLLVIFGSIAAYLYIRFSALAGIDLKPPPVTVAASVSRLESWENYLDAVGTVKAVRGVELTSEETGEIIRINFESGGRVEQGQLMVVLNDKVEQAEVQSRKATLELAGLLFEKDKKLVQQNSISQTQYDRSKADLERTQAQLAEAEARLANKHIRAPFSGVTGISKVAVGDYISPGTVITTLQDLSELEIDFTLPSQAAPFLKPGLDIELRVAAYPEKSFHASLFALDSKVDPDTRNITVRAKINEGEGLLPGMFAQLRVATGVFHQLVTVPQTAVTYSLSGNTVFVIEQNEQGELIANPAVVTVGETRNERISILSGLGPETKVVTAGQNKIYRDARIVIDEKVKF